VQLRCPNNAAAAAFAQIIIIARVAECERRLSQQANNLNIS
jgi:hypothetical protein